MVSLDLVKCCGTYVSDWARQHDSICVDFFQNKQFASWSVELNLVKIEFVLSKKATAYCPVSTLFCRVYLNKNDALFFHLPELIDYMDLSDFRCYYFPYIENQKRFYLCFNVLADFLNIHLNDIEQIASDSNQYNELVNEKYSELSGIFKIKDKDIPNDEDEKQQFYFTLISTYESFFQLDRYTKFDGYIEYLKGNYSKALKKYEKLKKKNVLTAYDKKLLSFIIKLDYDYDAIDMECASFLEVTDYNGGKKDLALIIKTFLLLFSVFTIFFFAAIMIANSIMSKDTLFYSGLNGWDSILFSALPAIFGSIILKSKFHKLFNKNDVSKAIEYDKILNSTVSKKISYIFFEIILIVVIVFFVYMLNGNLKVYDEYMLYKSDDFLSEEYEEYRFDELEDVYHIDGRYNDYGDWIERDSYVLLFTDGTMFDTDCILASKNDIEENFIPIIKVYVDEIKNVKSEKNII